MKKSIWSSTVALLFLSVFVIFFECPAQNDEDTKLSEDGTCTEYVLDGAHKIIDLSKIPHGSKEGWYSPDGKSLLKEIVIFPPAPNIKDGGYRYAYYLETEDIFWIMDDRGMNFTKGGWFGPYKGYPCVAKPQKRHGEAASAQDNGDVKLPQTLYDRGACTAYILDKAHKIIDTSKMPNISVLEEIILKPPDPNIRDKPWARAYYSKVEDVFWVADMNGFFLSWYGPYKGYPCK